jgi:hypothetical protein
VLPQAPNRIVQKRVVCIRPSALEPLGPTACMLSTVQGWGVVAEEALPAGLFVYEYVGELLDSAEAARRLQEYDALGTGHALLVCRSTCSTHSARSTRSTRHCLPLAAKMHMLAWLPVV